MAEYLDILGALLWITAALLEMRVRRQERRQLQMVVDELRRQREMN